MNYNNEPPYEVRAEDRGAVYGEQVSFFNKVYGMMTIGLLVTGFVAHYVAYNMQPSTLNSIWLPCIIAEFVAVWILSAAAMKMPAPVALLSFLGYAALNGVTLSVVFLVYTGAEIARVFYITAGMFGAMALYGTMTGRDLTGMNRLLTVGLFGIIIATLVNLFLRSTGLDLVLSWLGVAVFLGLVAYDTQKIRQISQTGVNHTGLAMLGALSLYLDFINLFLFLLRIFGGGRRR